MAAPSDTPTFQGGPSGTLLVDPDGLIRSADAGACELFGFAAEAVRAVARGERPDFVCEPSEMELAEHLACACGIGCPNASEMLLRRTEGQTFWARVDSDVANEVESESRDVVLVRLRIEEISDPMSDMERLFASEASEVFGSPRLRRTRVMLVDDQVTALADATLLLESLGIEVVGFSDAKLSLDEFTLRPDDYHAVIVDSALPPLDGLALCRVLLELHRDMEVSDYKSRIKLVEVYAKSISDSFDNDVFEVKLNNELGFLYWQGEQFHSAIEHYEKVVKILKAEHYPWIYFHTIGMLCRCNRLIKNYQKSLEWIVLAFEQNDMIDGNFDRLYLLTEYADLILDSNISFNSDYLPLISGGD